MVFRGSFGDFTINNLVGSNSIGVRWVIAEANIKYILPLTNPDTVHVYLRVIAKGKSQITLEYTIVIYLYFNNILYNILHFFGHYYNIIIMTKKM